MTSVILFNSSSETTDATIMYDGKLFISNQEYAGDYLLRIAKEEKLPLISALARALNKSDQYHLFWHGVDKTLLKFLKLMFARDSESPYLNIKDFLSEQGIQFKSEYWAFKIVAIDYNLHFHSTRQKDKKD